MKNFISFEFSNTMSLPSRILKYNDEFNSFPYEKKVRIVEETDNLVAIGNASYRSGNLENAINFYHLALNKHPINNDALQNMYVCYEELGMREKVDIIKPVWDIVKGIKGIY